VRRGIKGCEGVSNGVKGYKGVRKGAEGRSPREANTRGNKDAKERYKRGTVKNLRRELHGS
jgi:hypothetical protein